MIRSGLSGVCKCLLCPSLTSCTEEQAPQINQWMCFCHVTLHLQSCREKTPSAAVRSCTSCVCGGGEDGGNDNGTKMRRNLTSDELISSVLWWELSVMCSCFNWNYSDIRLSMRSQFCCLAFHVDVHVEDTPEIFFFPPFSPKHTFQYRRHVIQWDL